METISEPNRVLPILDQVDVLVVGGGPAGVDAALSAARLGARTLIVEPFNCLGGVATSGGRDHGAFSGSDHGLLAYRRPARPGGRQHDTPG